MSLVLFMVSKVWLWKILKHPKSIIWVCQLHKPHNGRPNSFSNKGDARCHSLACHHGRSIRIISGVVAILPHYRAIIAAGVIVKRTSACRSSKAHVILWDTIFICQGTRFTPTAYHIDFIKVNVVFVNSFDRVRQ